MKRFIPTNIWVTRSEIEPYQHGSWYNVSNLVKSNHETKYTVFENNPEYYIIPKSDVQGVLNDFEWLVKCLPDNLKWRFNGEIETIKNALIAQPDMVTIPRDKIQEISELQNKLWNKYLGGTGEYYPNNAVAFKGCLEKAISLVLNFPKEVD